MTFGEPDRITHDRDACLYPAGCSGCVPEEQAAALEVDYDAIYARLFDAMIAVARSAPDKPSHNAYAARIPWPKVTELRDALDAAEVEWR